MKRALSLLMGLLLMNTTVDAFAEYYIVYPGDAMVFKNTSSDCGGCRHYTCTTCVKRISCVKCDPCCSRGQYVKVYEVPVVNIYSSAPRRHAGISSGEVATYAWIPTPEAP